MVLQLSPLVLATVEAGHKLVLKKPGIPSKRSKFSGWNV